MTKSSCQLKRCTTPLLIPRQCLCPCDLSDLNTWLPDFSQLASHHSKFSSNVIFLVTHSSAHPIQSFSLACLFISLAYLAILLALILPDSLFVPPLFFVCFHLYSLSFMGVVVFSAMSTSILDAGHMASTSTLC